MPSTTLSSAGTATLLTDWVGAKATTVGVAFVSSTSSMAFTTPIQVGLPSTVSTGMSWFMLSTAAAGTYTASTHFDTVPSFQVLTPVAGIRVTSTGSATGGGITVTITQNAGG